MRDNVKSGALTEVTFYILLSLYSPKHGYAVMQFIEEKTGGRLSLGAIGSRHFIWCIKFNAGKGMD